MPLTNYERGRRFEVQIVHDLRKHGYFAIRATGSKGKADVVGIKRGEILMIQAKLNGECLPSERTALLLLARQAGALAIVAGKPRRGIDYRELIGPGPKEHRPWTPDTLGAVT